MKEKEENTLFYKFIADSPTVTMQRIKGITTGSLPTFIDVGSNFGGDAIVEDNLIQQLSFNDDNEKDQTIRKKVVFIGDDTWISLFPNHFDSQYPFPSFNVKDIHTVDDGVKDHLLPTITRIRDHPEEGSTWDVAIAHLLGVDHVGHTFGPDHPEMPKKLDEMDKFLMSIINNIDNETIFILFGDHGMTEDGNHGGSSDFETEAALFMYSPQIPINQSLPTFLKEIPETRSISQIDLVSTVSLMLGVPIPYGNLGSVIPELFLSTTTDSREGWIKLMEAVRLNTWQIKRYLDSYSQVSQEFPTSRMRHFNSILQETESKFLNIQKELYQGKGPVTVQEEERLTEIYQSYKHYQDQVVELCRRIWATFDTFSMQCGVFILICSAMSILLLIINLLTNPIESIQFPFTAVLLWSLFGGVSSLVWLILHAFSFGSNSFVEAQRNVVYFLEITIVLLLVGYLFYVKPNWSIQDTMLVTATMVSLFLTSPNFQSLNINQYVHLSDMYDTELNIMTFSTIVLNSMTKWLWCLPIAYLLWYQIVVKRLEISVGANQYVIGICLICLGLFWYVHSTVHLTALNWWIKGIFPWIIYSCTIGGMILAFVMVGHEVSEIYRLSKRKTLSMMDEIKFVLSKLISVNGYFFILMILVLGSEFFSTMLWLLIQTILISKLIGMIHLYRETCNSGGQSLSIYYGFNTTLYGGVWGFLTLLHFFSTGHDYSFNKIQFESAFIGFEDHVYWRGALLVILNTFCSPIFFTLFLPITTIYSKFLIIFQKKSDLFLSTTTEAGSNHQPGKDQNLEINLGENYNSKKLNQMILSWSSMNEIMLGYLSYLLFFLINTIMVCISVYGLRRHLMVWRVFAPKYIFETAQLLVVLTFLIISNFIFTYFFIKIRNFNKLK
eukprot:gene9321-11424_t